MATLLLFASIRQAAGCRTASVDGATVEQVLAGAMAQFGDDFTRLLPYCTVLVDEEPANASTSVPPDSEVALLPPVSGG